MRLSATTCCAPSKAAQFASLHEFDAYGKRILYDNDGYPIDENGNHISLDREGYPHIKRRYDVDYYDKDIAYKGPADRF